MPGEGRVRVTGVGGIFFRSKDPDALARWYEEMFGISQVSSGPWIQEGGPTVFSPFPADTDYFGSMDQPFMLNFRVGDIEAAISALEAADVRIDAARQDEPYGRFAWAFDPEGNKIELWEPKMP